jgi:hypothetical protein
MNRCNLSPLPRWLAVLAAAATALAGCGGGGSGTAPPAATVNTPPVAEFTSASSVVAGTPLALDASASSDADGDALTYSWSFGNGQLGGGQRIAALFADEGDHLVRLTVGDGRGGIASVERTVTVTAGPAAAGTVAALTIVRDASGALLSGVTVAHVAGGAPGLTGADGKASVSVDRAVSATLRFSKPGYADQIKAFTLPASAESGYLEVVMTPRMAAATLADAAAGGTIDGSDGARVSFEAGSLVDAAGAPVVGAVQVGITPIDVAANARAFPGKFEGTRPSGQQGLIESYGTAEFILTQAGIPVQLAPGRKATIEIPIYTAKNRDGSAVKEGDVFPLWSLNERSGTWIEEGSGRVVAAASPSGLALRGEVTHFSWWNHDQFLFPIAKPKPRCLVDTNADGILEDLTGTGHCWHAGTGPEQPTPFAPLAAGGDRKRAQAEPRTERIPTWIAEDFTPAEGGKVLLIPADLDITFRSYAKNGTLFGTTVVRLGADVEQDVPMLLEPVQGNPDTQAIALPFDDRFAVATRGEIDRFTFAAEAGASYDILVSRATSSLLGGGVRVLDAGGASVGSGGFATNAFATVVTASTAGTMTVEVTAGDAAPGSYRIEVRKLAGNSSNCSSPTTLALPSTGNYPIAANGSLCFDVPLVAEDAVEISNTSVAVARGNLRLFAPNGEQVAVDSYGGSAGGMLIRFGVAQSGTYRLQISNTEPLGGTIGGFSVARLAVAGTLDLSNSVAYAEAGTGANERYFVVKPGTATHLAIKVNAAANYLATVWPENITLHPDVGPTYARVVRTPPLALPIIEVGRLSGAGNWQLTLSARIPETLPLDSDLALSAPAPDDVTAYRIDGVVGQQWSAGISYASTAGFDPVFYIYAPVAGRLTPSNQVYTLPESGPYTVMVKSSFSNVGATPFNLRVNTAAPPEAISPSASTERASNLVLGEVRRYSFAVSAGQVLALRLSTPGQVEASAVLSGGDFANGSVTLSAPHQLMTSGPHYARSGGPAVLSLYGTSRNVARATGQVTLAIQAPTPTPTALGDPVSIELPPNTLFNHGYTILGEGKHLACVTGAPGPGPGSVRGGVWGPNPQQTNYTFGDLGTSGFRDATELIGHLFAGNNTLALMSSLPASTLVNFRLVALLPATDLVVGSGPQGVTVAPCERRYHQFTGTADQAYTVRMTAAFAGSVRVYKVSTSGDVTIRTTAAVGGTPLSLAAGIERVVAFTVPTAAPHGSGIYIVEVDGDGDAAGAYVISLTSP